MKKIKPFFINSNICIDDKDIINFDAFMRAVAGNTGNAYITYSLIKELGVDSNDVRHIQNIYQYDFTRSDADIEYINSQCSHVFLILQDQIRISESYGLQLPYQDIMNFISRLNKPVVVCGLGANSFNGFDSNFYKQLSPELVRFLNFISDHCVNIGVRGEFTADVLTKLGIKNVTVVGCPSFFESGPNRIINKKENICLDDILLTSRFCIPELVNNHTIMQDFQEEDVLRAAAFNDWTLVNDINEFKKLCMQKYHIFSNVQDWKNFISQFPFAVGYRLHGSIAAINAGVLSLCCNGDTRATEMCKFLHIPHNSNVGPDTDIIKLYNDLDVSDINQAYPKLYANFADFILKNTGIKIHGQESLIQQPHLNLYSLPNAGLGQGLDFIINKQNAIKNLQDGLDGVNCNMQASQNDIYSKINDVQCVLQNYIDKQKQKSKNVWYKKLFSVNKTHHHRYVQILGVKINIGKIKNVEK